MRSTITTLLILFLLPFSVFAFEPVKTELMKSGDKPVALAIDVSGVTDLYLIATYGDDSYDYDQAIWGEPTLFDAEGNAVRLTTLTPVSARTGWGTLLVNRNHQDRPLSIGGEAMQFGFWAHAPSILHFKLDGKYVRFETKVGLDTGSRRGTVVFQVRDTPVPFPSVEEYTRNFPGTPPPSPTATVPPVAEATFVFNANAAKILLDHGITELLFIRRLTFDGDHIYTEYVNSRWMPGGGLCVLNLETGEVREIIPEFTRNGVVGWFDLSFDAQRIVFDFKPGPLEGYRIFEVNIDGTGLRQLTFPQENEAELVARYRRGNYHHGTDDMEPAYLPDGGIVFATTRPQFSVLCDSGPTFTVKNLYRMNADGTGMRPLTFSPLSEATPTIMSDGRILYHRWEYIDKPAGNAKGLWSMNPDGTGVSEVYGNSITWPSTKIQGREIPGNQNQIVFLGASHCCPNNAVGTILVVDRTKNIRDPESMRYITDDVAAFGHNGFHFRDEAGNWYLDMTGRPGRLFRNPYPLSTELFIVSHKPAGLEWSAPAGYDLSLLDGQGRETLLLKDMSVSLWHAYPLVPRERPPVPAGNPIDAELAAQGLARAIVTDIYVGMENVERGDVRYIRILEQLPRPWSARKDHHFDAHGHAHSFVGDGSLSVKIQHGVVPVEEDGSAHFLIPAERAIYFQALNKNFHAIQTERTYINFMAGEIRGCIGCHPTPDIAAPPISSAVPRALLRAASIPGPQRTQTEATLVFDYDRQIQPILDRHCVACHGGDAMHADLDLRGIPLGVSSVSYQALIRLSKTDGQLLGGRFYRDEDAAYNSIHYIPPYQLGALSSPLAAMLYGWGRTSLDNPVVNQYAARLTEVHRDLRLGEAEKLMITNWLDINCQYHPSWWGRLHARFQDEPDFRPAFSFEEVEELMRRARD